MVMSPFGKRYKDEAEGSLPFLYYNDSEYSGGIAMHIEWNNGTVYDGDVNEEKQPHGKGRIVFPEGDHYEGDFYENTLTGEGVYTYTSGTVYRGHMINAIRNGYGESSFDNGTSYKGYWEDGLREGEGEQIYQDGFVYKGSWKNDLREGEGSLEYTQSFPYQHITGYFRNDVLYTGTFRYTWNDGYEVEGKYENGVELNTAVIRYPDGSVYEGEISHENGLICQGRGVLKDADGSTYEGTFDDNRKHGVFTVTKKDGSYQIVEYRKGELLAVIKSYDAKGNAVREEERETERNTPELIVDEEKYLTVQKEDDERYAERMARKLVEVKKFGFRRAKRELMQKGIDQFTAEDALEVYEFTFEENLAELLKTKHSRFLTDETDRKSIEKVKNALVRYGYDFPQINRAVKEYFENSKYEEDD